MAKTIDVNPSNMLNTPENTAGLPPPSGAIPPRPKTRRWMSNKIKYHHGSLPASAIQRGLEVVAQSGPMAVTMRGVARDLGVTAAALVHYFHNRAGLRSAIAHAAAEQMRPFSVVRSGGERAGERLRATAGAWVEYAANNPNLYRLVFGEGWRDGEIPASARQQLVYSVDRIANLGQQSGHIRPGQPREHGWLFFSAVHGLALARADRAAPHESVAPLIDRFACAIEAERSSQPPRAQTSLKSGRR